MYYANKITMLLLLLVVPSFSNTLKFILEATPYSLCEEFNSNGQILSVYFCKYGSDINDYEMAFQLSRIEYNSTTLNFNTIWYNWNNFTFDFSQLGHNATIIFDVTGPANSNIQLTPGSNGQIYESDSADNYWKIESQIDESNGGGQCLKSCLGNTVQIQKNWSSVTIQSFDQNNNEILNYIEPNSKSPYAFGVDPAEYIEFKWNIAAVNPNATISFNRIILTANNVDMIPTTQYEECFKNCSKDPYILDNEMELNNITMNPIINPTPSNSNTHKCYTGTVYGSNETKISQDIQNNAQQETCNVDENVCIAGWLIISSSNTRIGQIIGCARKDMCNFYTKNGCGLAKVDSVYSFDMCCCDSNLCNKGYDTTKDATSSSSTILYTPFLIIIGIITIFFFYKF